ncbi:MAG: hypothetical protein IPI83_07845 [Sphingomonadales bacterium]|nr:hypothetical protein [Sphingomonadales bacterium]
MNSPEDLARQRFAFSISSASAQSALSLPGQPTSGANCSPISPPALGYVLLIVGVLDFFLAPVLLKRNWRNPDA